MSEQPRQPAGSPDGGQFAATPGQESTQTLGTDQSATLVWSDVELVAHANRLYDEEQGWEAYAAQFSHEELLRLKPLCIGEAFDDEVFDALAHLDEAAAQPEPFVFDKNYGNHEQVRPYFAAYMQRRAELEEAGQYPYNDSFKGHIPGIEGPDEDRAIYMLQTMRDRDAMNAQRDAFLADGGREVTATDLEEGEQLRGTVVSYGFYMGGTGWAQYESARLTKYRGRLVVLERGKRTHGRLLDGTVLVRPENAVPAGGAR